MANSLVKYIPLTMFYCSIVIAIINFLLLEYIPSPIPNLFMFIIYSSIFFVFYGYITSYLSSKNKCNKINKKRSFADGIKSWILVTITYILIYFFSFLREPFNEIIGKGDFSNYIAEVFYISLNLILMTITNSYNSAKITCEMKPDEIKKNLKKLDVYLNKKFKKKRQKRIIVKD